MARTTISLPDDLKAEMDKSDSEANWSALAADAFRAEINRIRARKAALEGKRMQATVARLKASKAAYAKDANARGQIVGGRWASQEADYRQLKSLSLAMPLDLNKSDDPLPLVLRMMGNERARQDQLDFWTNLRYEHDNDDRDSGPFWDGFVAGALEVFKEVAPKL